MPVETTFPLILIVDDDVSLRTALQEICEFSGYHALTAAGAREALRLMRSIDQKPDLIISDVLMAEMDGYQFYQAVYTEEAWRDIPFIFLSAKSKLRDEAEKRGLRADRYLNKPFVVEDLLSAIARLVQH